MKVVLVYNPKSGTAPDLRELRSKFKRHSIQIDTVIKISDSLESDLTPFIRANATICAIGGDGTLSAVASYIAGSKAVLLPIPGGTLNHFTKDLGIPQDIDEVLRKLDTSKVHSVDIAKVNQVSFINNSSLGLYPSSLRVRERFEDHLGKWPAAVIASIRSFVRFRTYSVTINDETFLTPFIFVGNNNYALDSVGGVARTRLNEGVLSVMIAKTTTRWVLLKIVLWALIGKAHTLDEFETRTATSLTIHAKKRRLSVSRDGEVEYIGTPIRYDIDSKALRVRY